MPPRCDVALLRLGLGRSARHLVDTAEATVAATRPPHVLQGLAYRRDPAPGGILRATAPFWSHCQSPTGFGGNRAHVGVQRGPPTHRSAPQLPVMAPLCVKTRLRGRF